MFISRFQTFWFYFNQVNLNSRQDEENEASGVDEADIFETRSERIRRRLSLVIINIVGFISTLGFSIVLTGAYPYLLQVNKFIYYTSYCNSI